MYCIFSASNISVKAILDEPKLQYTCKSPRVNSPGEILVTVGFSSKESESIGVFVYHDDISIFSISPKSSSSGETITMEGSGFSMTRHLFCHFGSQMFMGNIISPLHSTCTVPTGIEGHLLISASYNGALDSAAISLHTIEVIDHSFSFFGIVPSTAFVNREQLFTVIGSRFSANLTFSSTCMQLGIASVISSTIMTVPLKPFRSGFCHVALHNLKYHSQNGVLVWKIFSSRR